MPTIEESIAKWNKDWEDVWNKGKVDLVDEHEAPNCVRHRTPFPDFADREAFKQHVINTRKALPDLHIKFDDWVVMGDAESGKVAVQYTMRFTHTGSPVTGAAVTGKLVTLVGCTVNHFVGGKDVEVWEYADYLGLNQQYGMVLKPKEAEK